jgi:hypothetical protein
LTGENCGFMVKKFKEKHIKRYPEKFLVVLIYNSKIVIKILEPTKSLQLCRSNRACDSESIEVEIDSYFD